MSLKSIDSTREVRFLGAHEALFQRLDRLLPTRKDVEILQDVSNPFTMATVMSQLINGGAMGVPPRSEL